MMPPQRTKPGEDPFAGPLGGGPARSRILCACNQNSAARTMARCAVGRVESRDLSKLAAAKVNVRRPSQYGPVNT